MAKARKGKFKCPRCDRTFSMAAHLARHKNSAHGPKKAKKKAQARKKTRRGRKAKRAGRPRGVASRMGLQNMSLEELSQLITAARAAARRKMAELGKALR